MSMYAIASAIEKFANNFREVIREKNAIEKDKLYFEKEKFEFSKQRLNLSNEQNNYESEYECEHDWRIVGSVAGTKAQYQVFVCSKCGAQQTKKTIIGRDGTYAVCFIDETND